MLRVSVLFFVLFFANCDATAKLVKLTCDEVRALVDDHNACRGLLARGGLQGQPKAANMKRMMWDEELAAKAETHVLKGAFKHNPDTSIPSGRFPTGENLYLYMTTDGATHSNVSQATASWFKEHHDYRYGKISVDAGSKPVGHYTQVVWADTMYVGCAVSKDVEAKWTKFLYVCNYGPAGNYLRQYPYEIGAGCEHLCCGTTDCSRLYGSKC